MNFNSVEYNFSAALEISSPVDRAAYLDRVCGEDADLRKRVEMLLDAQGEFGSFMEQPAVDRDVTLDHSTIQEGPGATIGPYKLLQQIGEGGFGVVYMAQQTEPIKRRVALKIIKLGMDTKQFVGRFEADLRNTAAGTPVTVNASGGDDVFNVGNSQDTINDVQSLVTLNGGGGTNTLNIHDQAATTGHTYTLESYRVGRTGAADVFYHDMDQLNLGAGFGDDVIDVTGTSSNVAEVNAGDGHDVINVGNVGMGLTSISSNLSINGQSGIDQLNLLDSAPLQSQDRTYHLTGSTLQIDQRPNLLIGYETFEGVAFYAGSGDDQIHLASSVGTTPTIVDAGEGDDEVRVAVASSVTPVTRDLTIDGGADTNRLVINEHNSGLPVSAGYTVGISNLQVSLAGSTLTTPSCNAVRSAAPDQPRIALTLWKR